MKRLVTLALSLALVFSLSSCKCSVERQAVSQVEGSHKLIATQLLKYVDADPKLDAKAKNDWKQMVEADQRNIDSLKKAME